MGRDPALLQEKEEALGDLVVHHALVHDAPPLLCVEGGGVVLKILNHPVGTFGLKDFLGLAFVDQLAFVHPFSPPSACLSLHPARLAGPVCLPRPPDAPFPPRLPTHPRRRAHRSARAAAASTSGENRLASGTR